MADYPQQIDVSRIFASESINIGADNIGEHIATLQTSQTAGHIGFTTKTLMDENLAYAAGTLAEITNDDVDPIINNGVYIKLGAIDEGSWLKTNYDRVALVEGRTTVLEQKSVYGSWVPVGGITELDGSNTNSFYRTTGFWETATQSLQFNAVSAHIWCANQTTDVEWKIFVRDTDGTFDTSSETPDDSGTIVAGTFPAADTLFTLSTNVSISVPIGKTVFILFHTVDNYFLSFRYWSHVGSATGRHAFIYSITGGWPTSLSFSTAGGLYDQVGILLLNFSDELRGYTAAKLSYDNTTSSLTATNVQTAIDEVLSTVNLPTIARVADHAIKQTVAYDVWSPAAGIAELDGSYDYAQKTISIRRQVTQDVVFNAIFAKVWCTNQATDIEWRLFVRDTDTLFDTTAETPVDSGTIPAGSFPSTSAGYTLELTAPISVVSGKIVSILYHATNNSGISIRLWSTAATGRQPLILGTANGWPSTMYFGQATYLESGYRLLNQLYEVRELSAANIPFDSTQTIKDAMNSVSAPVLVAPDAVYGLEDLETGLYFDNIILADGSEYDWSLYSVVNNGTMVNQNERFKWVPAGATTSGTMIVSCIDKKTGSVLATATVNLRAAAASAGTGATKKVLFIGDSLASGTVTALVALSGTDSMAITSLGTQGSAPNKCEGYPGWSTYSFFGVGSPFWISSAFDFPQYLIDNSIATPDWVLIQLGTNDVFFQTTDAGAIATATSGFDTIDLMIASIQDAGSINIGLCISPPPSYNQDAFGVNYGIGYNRARFKRNILLWSQGLSARYNGQEASGVYIIPSNVNIDTKNNMQFAVSAPVNSRSNVDVVRQYNGVHPDTPGYQQIADAIWAFLKCQV